ncbi:MAG TPA: lytic murein transglycosylase B [Steroidobacteraceae bacterium]|nr:lytic murein transglycosylase B [Steroidobacteraceae bacterium]
MSTRRPRQTPSRRQHRIACAALAALAAAPAWALDASREDVAGFVAELSTRYGFDAAALTGLMAQAQSQPSIVASISRPAEKTLSWQEYRARFITDRRVSRGAEVGVAQADALRRAAAGGVPAEYLLAITGVETFYGETTGKYRVVDALATLGFDYPPRSKFFRGQLEQYLLMAREESLDPLVPLGSYAGAMGVPQFMPGSFRAYAVDGDGDGRRDLWNDWSDVFASIANYLLQNGWHPGEPVMTAADVTGANLDGLATDRLALPDTVQSLRDRGVKFETTLPPDAPAVLIPLALADGVEYRVGFSNYLAITRYNRSELYASAVNDLAEDIARARTAGGAPAPAPRAIIDPSPPSPPPQPPSPTAAVGATEPDTARAGSGSFQSGPAPAPANSPDSTTTPPQ